MPPKSRLGFREGTQLDKLNKWASAIEISFAQVRKIRAGKLSTPGALFTLILLRIPSSSEADEQVRINNICGQQFNISSRFRVDGMKKTH